MLTNEEILEQRLAWSNFLSDFEAIYPSFAKIGISRNTALNVFVHYGGSAPMLNSDDDTEDESWKKS